MRLWLFILFVVVPVIELAVIIQVGGLIGVWPTVGLMLASGIAGSWLMRRQGAAALADAGGPATRVTSVESDPRATEHAGENLAAWVGARAETDRTERARWLVRVIVSLLSDPAGSPDAEADLLRRFVVPVIITGTG